MTKVNHTCIQNCFKFFSPFQIYETLISRKLVEIFKEYQGDTFLYLSFSYLSIFLNTLFSPPLSFFPIAFFFSKR